jgi:hypothetical protein
MTVTHNPFFKLKLIDLSDDTQVNSGGSTNTQTLQPAAGFIYQIVKIWVEIPDAVGSTAGTHNLWVAYDTSFQAQSAIFFMSSNTGNNIQTYANALDGDSEQPTASGQQQDIISGGIEIFCDYTNTIYFKYTNNLDANQTGTRTIKVLVKEYKEAV